MAQQRTAATAELNEAHFRGATTVRGGTRGSGCLAGREKGRGRRGAAHAAGWLLAGVAAAAGLLACGVDLERLDPSGQQVVFWHQCTDQRARALLDLIAEFNRTNPHGIRVSGEYRGNYGQMYSAVGAAIQQGAIPQLVAAYHNQAKDYYRVGAVVDLTPYMDSPGWGVGEEERADYVQAFLEGNMMGDVLVALRPGFSVELLYYNAEWLAEMGYERPPATWGELGEMCGLARIEPFSRADDPGHSLGLVLDVDASRLAAMVFSRGGDLMNPWRRSYTLDTPAVRKSLELLRDLRLEGSLGMYPDEAHARGEFCSGDALLLLGSSSRMLAVRDEVVARGAFAWDVAAVPHEGVPVHNIYGGSIAICAATPERQLASWIFLKWLTSAHQQGRWAQASGYFPVRRSAAPQLADLYRAAFSLLSTGKSEPAAEGYETVRRHMASAMVAIVDGADTDEVLMKLEEEANRTLEK